MSLQEVIDAFVYSFEFGEFEDAVSFAQDVEDQIAYETWKRDDALQEQIWGEYFGDDQGAL